MSEATASLSPPGFDFRSTLPADFIPTAVVTGDFNGDGHMDWAVANGGSNNIWIYLGNGDGTAQLPTIVTLTGSSPVGLAAVDMNLDGKLDLVVAESDSGTIGILLGNGDGTFGPERETSLPGGPACMAVADFNGDGNPDVVVGMAGVATGQLLFLPGDGAGNLGTPVPSTGPGGLGDYLTFDLEVADLNNDGKPDIVALDYRVIIEGTDFWDQMPYAGAYVYLNAGNGMFTEGQQFYSDSNDDPAWGGIKSATGVALGDVNGDGCVDAIVLDSEGVATLFPGNCDGTFNTTNPRLYGAGILAGAAALVDVNGDGHLDLVSSGFQIVTTGLHNPLTLGDCISVQLGDGTGNFSAPTLFRGEYGMFSLAVADLNGDGFPEVVTANQENDSVSVYLNNGQGGFGPPTGGYLGYLNGGTTNDIYHAPKTNFLYQDVNGDGIKDLVLLEYDPQGPPIVPVPTQLAALLGDGTGKFGSPIRSSLSTIAANPTIFDFALADFQHRGLPDLLFLGVDAVPNQPSTPPFIAYAKNNGDGTFQAPVLTPTPNACPEYFVLGDFNNDGKLDFMGMSVGCGPAGAPVLEPYLGNGDGTFREGTTISFNTSGYPTINGMLAVDVNGDGKLDLLLSGNALISSTDSNAMYELLGNGDGTFQAPKLLFSNPGPTSYFAAADLNGDGIPDLVEMAIDSNNETSTYRTYLGQAGGSFVSAGTYGPLITSCGTCLVKGAPDKPMWPFKPVIGDFNGDGKFDVLTYMTGNSGAVTSIGGGGTMTVTGAWADTVLQVLAGNGDGTLSPSNLAFSMGDDLAPQQAVDVNGDGRTDLLEMDSYSSSYNVITAQPGASFAVELVSSPVLGASGELQVSLAFPSGSATTVQLSASDPNISIPPSVTIPAGALAQTVAFQIGGSFNASHVFSLTGQIGSESHVAYGWQAASSSGLGFVVAPATSSGSFASVSVVPAQPASFQFWVQSVGGYSTQIQPSCQGLPASAACQFDSLPIPLGAGVLTTVTLTITSGTNAPVGMYNPTVVFTDGVVTQQVTVPIIIGTFSMSIAPSSQTTAATGEVSFEFWLSGTPGYTGPVQISFSGLPAGSAPGLNTTEYTTAAPAAFPISTFSATPGTYPFTIMGTAGPMTKSVSATLIVQGSSTPPSFTGSISPTSATLAVGQSAKFNIALNSQNAAAGAINLQCPNLATGLACTFTPASPSLPANGSIADTLTVQANSKPAAAPLSLPAYWAPPGEGRRMIWLLAAALACLAAGLWLRSRKLDTVATGTALLGVTLLFLATASCGGGGGGGPAPTPQPVTVTVTVQASGAGVSGTQIIGTLSITVN
jgi:hypothetical protein